MKRTERVARAVFFDAPGEVSVRPVAVNPGPDEEIVTSELIGISHGTELLFYEGPFPRGHLLEERASIGESSGYPIRYGYMNVGRTDDGRRVFAFAPHQDLFAAPRSGLLDVPDDVTADDAVLYPSVETALQIVHDAHPSLGDRVLVLGLGVVGLLVSRLLARFPVRLYAADPLARRRARARESGARLVDPADTAATQIIDETGGIDIAINASASPAALQLAIDTLVQEGTVIEASWYGERVAPLDLGAAFHRRRITIRASQVSNLNPAMQPRWTRERRTREVWRLVHELSPGSLVTHRFALDDATRAYEVIAKRTDDLLQAVLVP